MEVTGTTIDISRERIADTLCCALEGGSTYWCESLSPDFNDAPPVAGDYWAHDAMANDAPFTFTIIDEEDNQKPTHTLTAALELMAADYPRHFDDMVKENEDADTGDVLFQLMCFGEVVYC